MINFYFQAIEKPVANGQKDATQPAAENKEVGNINSIDKSV